MTSHISGPCPPTVSLTYLYHSFTLLMTLFLAASGLIACRRNTKLQKWIDQDISSILYLNFVLFLGCCEKNRRQNLCAR